MSKQKIYAIKKGKSTGIFNTWEECKKLVTGYANAEYKSFVNLTDAIAYLNEDYINKNSSTNQDLKEIVKKEIESGITVAFVDGSYEHSIKKYSYGAYIQTLQNNKIVEYKFYESFNDAKYLPSRNVSGEIFGIIKTLEWCLKNNIKNVKFYYDYAGIEKWITNEWNANTEISVLYKNVFNQIKHLFNSIQFQKVSAHTGIEYNDIADQLAKDALLK